MATHLLVEIKHLGEGLVCNNRNSSAHRAIITRIAPLSGGGGHCCAGAHATACQHVGMRPSSRRLAKLIHHCTIENTQRAMGCSVSRGKGERLVLALAQASRSCAAHRVAGSLHFTEGTLQAAPAEVRPAAPLPGVAQAAAGGGPPRCKLVLLGDSGVGKSCIVQVRTAAGGALREWWNEAVGGSKPGARPLTLPAPTNPAAAMPKHIQSRKQRHRGGGLRGAHSGTTQRRERQIRNLVRQQQPQQQRQQRQRQRGHQLQCAFALCHTVPALPPASCCRDTAGQERYESLAPLYYRGAHAAAVVFDVGSERSFRRAQHWVGELRRNAAGQPLLVLVGNKADLPLEERAVEAEEARALADR